MYVCGKQVCRRWSRLPVKVCCGCRIVVKSLLINSAPSNESHHAKCRPGRQQFWDIYRLAIHPRWPPSPSSRIFLVTFLQLLLSSPFPDSVSLVPVLHLSSFCQRQVKDLAWPHWTQSLDSEDHWSRVKLHGHSVSRRFLPESALPHSLVPSYSSVGFSLLSKCHW